MSNDTLKNKSRAVQLLLVEDNKGDALLISRAFLRGQIAIKLTVASTGEEALQLLENQVVNDHSPSYDLILLDLNLPGISGHEVLKNLKNNTNTRQIPVVVLSSSQAEYDVTQSYSHHANCYIKKASNLDELYVVVEQIEQFWFNYVTLPDAQALNSNSAN